MKKKLKIVVLVFLTLAFISVQINITFANQGMLINENSYIDYR